LAQSWTDIDLQEQWALSADELALLPGMTDTGRLAFAVQLKFMEIHGRFPERHDEIDPAVLDWLATQVGSGSATDGFVAFELDGRQGRRQRRTIRGILGIRPTTSGDRQRLSDWLANDVLPFDPQARHGRDLALPPNSSTSSGNAARPNPSENYGVTPLRSATAWWPCFAGDASNSSPIR
jgi:hypothetical protein